MKRRLIIAGIVLIAVIAVTLYIRYGNSRDQDAMTLSGNVEVTEVNVGFKIPGRVLRLYTDEGRTVTSSEKIAELDNAEYESMVNQSKASVLSAEAQYEKAHKDY
jgi:HlyD family secretion protein